MQKSQWPFMSVHCGMNGQIGDVVETRLGGRDVDPVRQGGDDEARTVSDELEGVVERGIQNVHLD